MVCVKYCSSSGEISFSCNPSKKETISICFFFFRGIQRFSQVFSKMQAQIISITAGKSQAQFFPDVLLCLQRFFLPFSLIQIIILSQIAKGSETVFLPVQLFFFFHKKRCDRASFVSTFQNLSDLSYRQPIKSQTGNFPQRLHIFFAVFSVSIFPDIRTNQSFFFIISNCLFC